MAKNKLKQASERTVGRKAADWANPFVSLPTKIANAATFVVGANKKKRDEDIARAEQEKRIGEAELHNTKVDSQSNARMQAEMLKAIMAQSGSYQQQAPYLEEYFNLIQDEFPGRGQRMQELDAYGNGQGARTHHLRKQHSSGSSSGKHRRCAQGGR